MKTGVMVSALVQCEGLIYWGSCGRAIYIFPIDVPGLRPRRRQSCVFCFQASVRLAVPECWGHNDILRKDRYGSLTCFTIQSMASLLLEPRHRQHTHHTHTHFDRSRNEQV